MDVRGKVIEYVFQSTPPLRVETQLDQIIATRLNVSTHTTLVGGDVGGIAGNEHVLISIHTILADRDKKAPVRSVQRREFQSTPPLRVETENNGATISDSCISIHTTLAGGDCKPVQRYSVFPIQVWRDTQFCLITSNFSKLTEH